MDTFYTEKASGSVSQAANIVEGLYAGSRLLLVDEDKSATNFLVKDELMRKINPRDPIIPLTDRIREIVSANQTSVIIVVGAVSSYFEYADVILLAERYVYRNVTGIVPKKEWEEVSSSAWSTHRYYKPSGEWKDCLFRTVNTENSRTIIIDKCSADVLPLAAIVSNEQLNALAKAMERLLSRTEGFEIKEAAEELSFDQITQDEKPATNFERMTLQRNHWFEAVRPIDVICCLSRMRGIQLRG